MLHFISNKDGIEKGLNICYKGVIFIDGKHMTLDIKFTILKGILLDDIEGKGAI